MSIHGLLPKRKRLKEAKDISINKTIFRKYKEKKRKNSENIKEKENLKNT